MYIIKNAFRCISRSLFRNVLIGIIVLVIAVSSCIGLSIRKASETAADDMMEGLFVTATISFDRQSAMKDMFSSQPPSNGGSFDKNSFSEMMGQSSQLSLEELTKYSEAKSVDSFYYTISCALNGSDDFSPVTSDSSSDSDDSEDTEESQSSSRGRPEMPGMGGMGMPGDMMQMLGANSDFTIVGVSSDEALTSFANGTASITDGQVFEEGSTELYCIITEELAIYNDISTGDTILLTNPNNSEETYTLTVSGIYTDSSVNEESFSFMGSASADGANKIYMSAAALKSVVERSEEQSTTLTDSDTGREYETALTNTISATYVFEDTDKYHEFETEVREMGLSDSYTVSSKDIQSFESSLLPLETLATMAGWFLLVILIIGAVILTVLNIFNVRERKYEIGVLCAMGMKKGKVALQFVIEIFAVTLAAVIIGAAIGAVASVPVTNALLQNQVDARTEQSQSLEESFGRPGNGFGGQDMAPPSMPDGTNNPFGGFDDIFSKGESYITEIESATDFTVLLQMLGIAVLLTIVSGAVSMLFVMRYEPLKILANRD